MSRPASPAALVTIGGLALFSGALVYVFGRPLPPRVLSPLRELVPPTVASPVVANVVPDALWSLALVALLAAPWPPRSQERPAWMILGAFVSLGWEVGQGLRLIPGTFDPLDLLATAFGIAAAVYLASSAASQRV